MALLSVMSVSLALLPGTPHLMGRAGMPQQQLARRASLVRCEAAAPVEIAPPKLESEVGFDFVPLLTALKTSEFREADQLTRDALGDLLQLAALEGGGCLDGTADSLCDS